MKCLVLPEFRIRVVEDYFCRTPCRGEEVRSRNTKTLKERGGNEMGSVCHQGWWRPNLELGNRREAEERVWERFELLEKIHGNSMVSYVEETPFLAGQQEGWKRWWIKRLRLPNVKNRKLYRSLRLRHHPHQGKWDMVSFSVRLGG